MEQNLKDIETLVFLLQRVKNKEDIPKNLGAIERLLERMFDDIDFRLSISSPNSLEFFGVNIFPSIETMDKLVDNIVKKYDTVKNVISWQKNKTWFIELDHSLLYDVNLFTSPAEIASLMIREVGYVIYSNSIPVRINFALRERILKLPYDSRQLLTTSKIRKIINICIIDACSTKNFKYFVDDDDLGKMSEEDRFLKAYGLQSDYESLITKILHNNGNTYINRTDDDMNREMNTIVTWLMNQIIMLRSRKTELKRALRVESLKTPSNVIKKVVEDVYTTLFGHVTDKYRNLLSENATIVEMKAIQSLDDELDRIKESVFEGLMDKIGQVKKINPIDIDIIEVDVDKIETHDDKIYVLDKIYAYLDLVNYALDMSDSHPNRVKQPKSQLVQMRDNLLRLQSITMAKRIVPKEYGVFIRYPKGYQG